MDLSTGQLHRSANELVSTCKNSSDQTSDSKDSPDKELLDNAAQKSQTIADKETYEKDGLSRSFHGVVYQLKLILLFMKRGANKQYKFRMATERIDAGKFDDIEFQYIDQGVQKYRMIQVKHRYDDSEKITAKALESLDKGDFCLKKYFVSYRDIQKSLKSNEILKDLIIFTNANLEQELKTNNFEELTDEDDILDISDKRGKRYKLKTDCKLKGNLMKILRDSSDLELLTKILENCIKNGKVFDLNTPLLKKYHVALARSVIDAKGKKVNMSDEIPQYMYGCLKRYQGYTIEATGNFGIGIDKNPQLTVKQSSAIIKTISEAFANNDIDFIRLHKKMKVAKLAGHVFVERSGKIKFRKGFFTDPSLPGNVAEFQVALSKLNNDLRNCTFDIRLPICSEEDYEKYRKDPMYFERLPDDTVSDSEIEDFFEKLVFAVDQPNERQLMDIIGITMREGNSLSLVDQNIEINELYKQVIEWMKEKVGSYLTYEDCQVKVKQQVSKMELFGFKRLICEEIKGFAIDFQDRLTVLQEFLKSKDEQILILENSHNPMLSSIKVYHTLVDLDDYKKVDSFIFLRQAMMKSYDVTKLVLEAFESPHYSHLLVVECSANDEEINGYVFSNLLRILQNNEKKKLVLTTTKAIQLPKAVKSKIFQDNKNALVHLTIESQQSILESAQIIFQGHAVSMTEQVSESLWHHIDGDFLIQIMKKEKIYIGQKLPDLTDMQDYYVSRKLKEIELKFKFRNSLDFCIANKNLIKDSNVNQDQDIVSFSNDEREFDALCEKYKTKNIHWINKNFIWQKSFGTQISKLRDFLYTQTKNVKKIHEITNKVVLIAAPPGMGKSTELTSFAEILKNSDPYLWVLRVNLIEISSKIKDLTSDFGFKITVKFLKDFFSVKQENLNTGLNNLEDELFDSYYEQGKLILLLDGFDEICPIYKKKVFKLLKVLKDSKVKRLCVTTRIYGVLHELEDTLVAFSYTFEDLKYDDQIKIMVGIWKRKSNPDDEEKHRSKAEKLLKLFDKSFYNNPLQIKIVAMAFREETSREKQIDVGNFNLAELYEHFFNVMFDEVYIQEKNPGTHKDKDQPETADHIETKRKCSIEFHKHLAPYAIFGKEVEKLCPEFKDVSAQMEEIHSGKYKMGIVVKVTDGVPIFVHRTFAEYFCALLLVAEENWKIPEFQNFFKNYLIEQPMIMKFCGYLLNKNTNYKTKYSVHLAILLQNEADLKALIKSMETKKNEKLFEKDEFLQCSPLVCAAMLKYMGLVDILLKNGAYDNQLHQILNENSLNAAVSLDYLEIVKFFDSYNYMRYKNPACFKIIAAQCDASNDVSFIYHWWTMQQIRGFFLLIAARENSFRVAEYLISTQATLINFQNKFGETPLPIALNAKALEVVFLLVNQPEIDINVKDLNGDTPLHLACEKGAFEICKCLVKRENVHINAQNNSGQTILHIASASNALKIVELVVSQPKTDINVTDSNGDTALHIAAKKGAFETLTCLVKQENVNINVQNDWGQTPLHAAINSNVLANVKILVNDPNLDINLKDRNGDTPLHLVAKKGAFEILQCLVERENVNWNAQNNFGHSLLHIVSDINALEIVDLVVNQPKFDINLKDRNGDTPLHLAAEKGALKILNCLAKRVNVNVNAQNDWGQTPLHFAAKHNDLVVTKILIDQPNIDISIKDKEAKTPLDLASHENIKKIFYDLSTYQKQ